MSILLTLLDHVAWADARAHAAIRTLDADRPERAPATRIYAHLAAAEHVWLARLEGRTPAYPVWPDLSLDEAEALATRSVTGLRAIAAGDAHALAREIEYRTMAGDPFRNTVADVLAQVALHGSHHRGQLALLVRQGGGTPAMADYIVFARDVATPAPSLPDASSRDD